MRKSKGNMYDFVTHTWNPIKGECEHDCSYCYMKRFKQKELHLDLTTLTEDLGEQNKIFVCSGTDMFAPNVPTEWIESTLHHMKRHNNTYFLHSKNPMRMLYFIDKVPTRTTFCTTMESDKDYPEKMGKSPNIMMRYAGIKLIKDSGFRVMVTIEPIMDFDVLELSSLLISLKPFQVNIGADSRGSKLKEPGSGKISKLIENLERQKIIVHQKLNLQRLLK